MFTLSKLGQWFMSGMGFNMFVFPSSITDIVATTIQSRSGVIADNV